jgi:hypothetical protein
VTRSSVLVMLLVGLVLAACSAEETNPDEASITEADYAERVSDQTWTKQPAATNCDEYTNTMTPAQREAFATTLLRTQRQSDGLTQLPSLAQLAYWESALEAKCTPTSSMDFTDADALRYVTDLGSIAERVYESDPLYSITPGSGEEQRPNTQ